MVTEQSHNHKRFRINDKEFQMVWEANTISSPKGATVVAVDFSRPEGKREIFRKKGHRSDLNQLQWEAEQAIEEAAR
jgi:hypothetical protein